MNIDSVKEYKIIEELGKGSYGTVYKVSYRGELRVMKQININHMNDKKQQAALKEVSILKQVCHPNIIRYYTSFISKGIIHIIMEFADKGDLMMYIKSQRSNFPINEQLIWSVAFQLTEAISHLHSLKIIHRDIKPLNIFLTKENQIKLGDMGVSKIMNDQQVLQGTRVGTPLFLAPELIQQKPYDFKIDVWSLGCVLFYLCTMTAPFSGENLIQLGYNIVNKQPKSINSIYSGRLQNFIQRLMQKDPSNRPSIFEVQNFFKDEFFKGLQSQQVVYNTIHTLDTRQSFTIKEKEPKDKKDLPTQNEGKVSSEKTDRQAFQGGGVVKSVKVEPKNDKRAKNNPSQNIFQEKDPIQEIHKIRINIVPNVKKYSIMNQGNLSQEDRFKQIIDKLSVNSIRQEYKKIPTTNNLLEAIDSHKKSPRMNQKQKHPLKILKLAGNEVSQRRFKVVSTSLHQQRDTSRGKIQEYVRMNFVPCTLETDESREKPIKGRSQSPKKFFIR